MKCLQAVTIYILNKASAVCQSVNMNISCLVFNGDKQYYKQFYRQRNINSVYQTPIHVVLISDNNLSFISYCHHRAVLLED